MKLLIIRTDIDETESAFKSSTRSLTGTDSAITMELYKKYRLGENNSSCRLHITANHTWSKYTFIDEKNEDIGTFRTMDDLQEKNPFLGNTLILTHEQWLDKANPNWKTVERYQYW